MMECEHGGKCMYNVYILSYLHVHLYLYLNLRLYLNIHMHVHILVIWMTCLQLL